MHQYELSSFSTHTDFLCASIYLLEFHISIKDFLNSAHQFFQAQQADRLQWAIA